MKVLGLIPARGGSKGIPRKNVRMIAGRPLIAWSIEAALRSRHLDRVVVSTEDESIADVARRSGADVPFLRPAELARDESNGVDPVLHAVATLPEFDAVVLLQPTSPLRTSADIDGCVDLALSQDAASVVSVTPSGAHPRWIYRIDPGLRLAPVLPGFDASRRQDLEPAYVLNGAVYFSRVARLLQERTLLGPDSLAYVMPEERSIDIDTALDWRIAEMLLGDPS
jgi:CMP-N,N'-diacetyllegionaminic acid synthase